MEIIKKVLSSVYNLYEKESNFKAQMKKQFCFQFSHELVNCFPKLQQTVTVGTCEINLPTKLKSLNKDSPGNWKNSLKRPTHQNQPTL